MQDVAEVINRIERSLEERHRRFQRFGNISPIRDMSLRSRRTRREGPLTPYPKHDVPEIIYLHLTLRQRHFPSSSSCRLALRYGGNLRPSLIAASLLARYILLNAVSGGSALSPTTNAPSIGFDSKERAKSQTMIGLAREKLARPDGRDVIPKGASQIELSSAHSNS